VARRSSLGLAIQEYLDRGEFVPDEIVLDMVRVALVAAKAATLSGRAKSDGMNVVELQTATSLLAKTIGSRLSELNKSGAVDKVESEGTGRYRITTTGVHWLHAQLSKKFPKSPQGP